MLKMSISGGMSLLIFLSTACTVKGTGSERTKYDSTTSSESGDAEPATDEASGEEVSETCLKLAEKRKNNLKLLEDGEETEEETAEETASCPADTGTDETATTDETSTEETSTEE